MRESSQSRIDGPPVFNHRYRFLVDGKSVLDPQGTGIARNEPTERISLIAVS